MNYQPGESRYLANGFFGTNMYPTQTNPNTKLGSSRRDSNKNIGLITTRYSPLVKMTTLRLLVGSIPSEDLELEQLNVKTPFLHKDLEEDIYMSQPAGFLATGEKSHLTCRLKKSF